MGGNIEGRIQLKVKYIQRWTVKVGDLVLPQRVVKQFPESVFVYFRVNIIRQKNYFYSRRISGIVSVPICCPDIWKLQYNRHSNASREKYLRQKFF